jgi:hypothetical protein
VHLVALVRQDERHGLAQARLVVNDQYNHVSALVAFCADCRQHDAKCCAAAFRH